MMCRIWDDWSKQWVGCFRRGLFQQSALSARELPPTERGIAWTWTLGEIPPAETFEANYSHKYANQFFDVRVPQEDSRAVDPSKLG